MLIGYSIIEDQCIKSLDRRPQTAFRAIGVCLLELFIKMRSGISLLQFTRNLESLLHSTQEGTCRIHITSSIQLKNFVTLPHKSRGRKNFKICYPPQFFPELRLRVCTRKYAKMAMSTIYKVQILLFFSSSPSSIPLGLLTQSRQDRNNRQNV